MRTLLSKYHMYVSVDLFSRCMESVLSRKTILGTIDKMAFDEENESLMNMLSASMAQLVPASFADSFASGDTVHTRHCCTSSNAKSEQISRFVGVVDQCLGPLYVKHNGIDWQKDKFDEMSSPGLVYVWYERENQISCMISFRMVSESVGKTLYLYEIHVNPSYQRLMLGSRLMDAFHDYSVMLNKSAGAHLPASEHFPTRSTGLTVFSDNTLALKWYLRRGYTFAPDSPIDKSLRGGKVIKPSFYNLIRPVEPHG